MRVAVAGPSAYRSTAYLSAIADVGGRRDVEQAFVEVMLNHRYRCSARSVEVHAIGCILVIKRNAQGRRGGVNREHVGLDARRLANQVGCLGVYPVIGVVGKANRRLPSIGCHILEGIWGKIARLPVLDDLHNGLGRIILLNVVEMSFLDGDGGSARRLVVLAVGHVHVVERKAQLRRSSIGNQAHYLIGDLQGVLGVGVHGVAGVVGHRCIERLRGHILIAIDGELERAVRAVNAEIGCLMAFAAVIVRIGNLGALGRKARNARICHILAELVYADLVGHRNSHIGFTLEEPIAREHGFRLLRGRERLHTRNIGVKAIGDSGHLGNNAIIVLGIQQLVGVNALGSGIQVGGIAVLAVCALLVGKGKCHPVAAPLSNGIGGNPNLFGTRALRDGNLLATRASALLSRDGKAVRLVAGHLLNSINGNRDGGVLQGVVAGRGVVAKLDAGKLYAAAFFAQIRAEGCGAQTDNLIGRVGADHLVAGLGCQRVLHMGKLGGLQAVSLLLIAERKLLLGNGDLDFLIPRHARFAIGTLGRDLQGCCLLHIGCKLRRYRGLYRIADCLSRYLKRVLAIACNLNGIGAVYKVGCLLGCSEIAIGECVFSAKGVGNGRLVGCKRIIDNNRVADLYLDAAQDHVVNASLFSGFAVFTGGVLALGTVNVATLAVLGISVFAFIVLGVLKGCLHRGFGDVRLNANPRAIAGALGNELPRTVFAHFDGEHLIVCRGWIIGLIEALPFQLHIGGRTFFASSIDNRLVDSLG